MSASQVDFQVLDVTDIKTKEIRDLSGVFFVAHAGAERFRSYTKPVSRGAATFNESVSFIIPYELDEIKVQLWGENEQNTILLGDEDIDPENIGKQQLKLLNKNSKVCKLNIDVKSREGSYEDFGVQLPQHGVEGVRSISSIEEDGFTVSYDPNSEGVGAQELSRGIFGNTQQQYSTPPLKPGYQGPGEAGGRSRSIAGNVIKGVAGAALIIGLGYLWYKHRQHKQNKKMAKKQAKKDHRDQRKAEKLAKKNNLAQTTKPEQTAQFIAFPKEEPASTTNTKRIEDVLSYSPPSTPMSNDYKGPPGMCQTPPQDQTGRAYFNRTFQSSLKESSQRYLSSNSSYEQPPAGYPIASGSNLNNQVQRTNLYPTIGQPISYNQPIPRGYKSYNSFNGSSYSHQNSFVSTCHV